MPVTELTQFRPLVPTTFLASKELGWAMNILRDTTGHTAHLLLSGTNDVFLIESWDEVSSHEKFQKTEEHDATISVIDGKMEVLSIRHMNLDIKGTTMMQKKWRGEVTIVETKADVQSLVEGDHASAKVIDEDRGYLFDWSEDQQYAKALVKESGDVWFRTAKVLDI